jgi:hypothetical protein
MSLSLSLSPDFGFVNPNVDVVLSSTENAALIDSLNEPLSKSTMKHDTYYNHQKRTET